MMGFSTKTPLPLTQNTRRLQPSLGFPHQAITALPQTSQGTVKHIIFRHVLHVSRLFPLSVRIWDIAGTDQVLKLATRPLGGRINDLSWDGESKRIIAVGDGRERFGAAFLADSGSSCGEIQGNSKVGRLYKYFPLESLL